MTDFIPIIGTLLLVFLILYLSYAFSRYVGNKSSRLTRSKYMNVLDQIMIGPDRFLMIIEIGKKKYLIGTSVSDTRMLAELAEEDLQELENNLMSNTITDNFKDIFSKLKNNKKN